MACFRMNLTSGRCDTRRARHQYTDWLASRGIDPSVVEDWAIVFSELANNACTAAPAATEIIIEASANEKLLLRVSNVSTDTVPAVRPAVAHEEVSSRGLLIATALTDRLDIEVSKTSVQITCIGATQSDRLLLRLE